MFPAYFLLFLALSAAEQVSITDFAVPSEVKAGENAELQCRYSLQGTETALFYIKWWWTPFNDSDKSHLIYQRLGHHTAQTSHRDLTIKPNDTIELANLQPGDSGTYECEVSNIDEARRKQDLTVYTPGTGPLLNLTAVQNGTEDVGVLVSCEAEGAAPEPELVITVDGKEAKIEEVSVTEFAFGEYSIVANLTLEELEVGSEVRCELFYPKSNVTHTAYIASEVYEGSGAELPSTETVELTTEWEATTAHVDGSTTTAKCPWLLLLASAVLARMLASH